MANLDDILVKLSPTEMGEIKELTSKLTAAEGVVETRKLIDVTRLSPVQRLAILVSMFIRHPGITALLTEFRECHLEGVLSREVSGEPDCMFIEGDSNVGKTAVWEFYERAFTRELTPEKTIVRVLPVVLPYPAKPKSVATELLKKLGDPFAERGTTSILGSRVSDYIGKCETELIILDELHHFIERGTNKILHDASEWLKRLIKVTKVPVIALGTPRAREVLDYDDQLKRLFPIRKVLTPFSWDYAQPDNMEFRRFLNAIDLWLPLANTSRLSSPEMALRIHYATDGFVGWVTKYLIRGAARLAFIEGAESISLDHLGRSFEAKIKSIKPFKRNPFHPRVFTTDLAIQWRREECEHKAQMEKPSHKSDRLQRASQVLRT